MTDEELQAIRVRLEDRRRGFDHSWHADGIALLAYVDFLRTLLNDLQQDSSAYQRGMEEGRKQERERNVAVCRHIEEELEEVRELQVADGARQCRTALEAGYCPRCLGKGLHYRMGGRARRHGHSEPLSGVPRQRGATRMTTLESLARALAAEPDDEATLAAFVDCLKEADGSQAMQAMRLLLPQVDEPVEPTPPQPLDPRQRHLEKWRENLRQAAWQQQERDELIARCVPWAMLVTAAVVATTLSFLGF